MLVAGVLLASAEPWHPDASRATNAAVLLFAAAVMAVGLVPLLPGPWRTTFLRRRGPEAEVPHQVVLGPAYLAMEQDGIERRFSWANVQNLRITASFVTLDLPERRLVLPHRVFTDSHERDTVVSAIRTWKRDGQRAARQRRRRRTTDPFAPPRQSER
ncbi:MAG: hypothetical protein AAGA48_07690 [Myxococcota bacterium]